MDRLDRFFEISERRSTVGAELRGGLVTFIAMAYIIVLNPIILSSAPDVDGHKLDFAQVSAITSLAAGVMSILFGGVGDAGVISATVLPSPPVALGTGGVGTFSTVPTLVFVFTLLVTGIL